MRCNLLDEQTVLLSLFGNRALYLIRRYTTRVFVSSVVYNWGFSSCLQNVLLGGGGNVFTLWG